MPKRLSPPSSGSPNLADRNSNPTEVVVEGGEEAVATPDKEDDFFSSWDKPAIKRPTPPPSRTATPPVVGRNPSPLTPGAVAAGNGIDRSKSPLGGAAATPAASRITTSSALRSKPGATGARKSGVLGAKKGAKLGAKKIGAGETIDFDEAEKKAKEEAERIAKLGYDPEAEDVAEKKTEVKVAPVPAAEPARGHARNSSDVERLGLQMNRLGFGQVAGAKVAAPAKKMGGFGSTSAAAVDEDESFAREKFGQQKSISSDEFFGRNTFDPQAQAEARTRLQGFDGATSISSNQYFGREEEEDAPIDLSDYGSLEVTARELARKFAGTAGEDLENLTAALGQGADKLQNAVRQ
jgi:ADP-ribosylation factor GTPase-activating protein 2/3